MSEHIQGPAVKQEPLASIVIPSNNRKTLLPDAVDSCLNQAWRHLEVIIVDDGSTDGTTDLVAERLGSSWQKDRVRYVRQENQGASAARNHGLHLAQGEYVQFLDSDDLLDPTKLMKQIGIMEQARNAEAACCYCHGALESITTESGEVSAARIGYYAQDPNELVRNLCSRIVHGMQTAAPLWRRSFLIEHAGWREDISLGDDLEYHVRLLVAAKKICFINEELFVVREHCGSRLSADRMTAKSLRSLITTRRSVRQSLQLGGLWDAQTQRAFLGAMRTIYANALQLGDHAIICELENWLWTLASSPGRIRSFQTVIVLRRVFGRRCVLGSHKLIARMRPE